jgi:hypothetical protein
VRTELKDFCSYAHTTAAPSFPSPRAQYLLAERNESMAKGPPTPMDPSTHSSDLLVSLSPNWKKRKKMIRIREKTLFRYLMSKFYHQGLEYCEIELLIQLCQGNKSSVLYIRWQQTFDTLPPRSGETLKSWEKRVCSAGGAQSLPVFLLVNDLEGSHLLYKTREMYSLVENKFFQRKLGRLWTPFHREVVGTTKSRRKRRRGHRDGRTTSTRNRLAIQADRDGGQRIHEDRLKTVLGIVRNWFRRQRPP